MAGKYHNVKVEEGGHTFDSKAEHRRYKELLLLLGAGEINTLEVHPQWNLIVNGKIIGKYIADFSYKRPHVGTVIEDVKGVKTAVYQLKKKIIKAYYGIDITEVES